MTVEEEAPPAPPPPVIKAEQPPPPPPPPPIKEEKEKDDKKASNYAMTSHSGELVEEDIYGASNPKLACSAFARIVVGLTFSLFQCRMDPKILMITSRLS